MVLFAVVRPQIHFEHIIAQRLLMKLCHQADTTVSLLPGPLTPT